MKITISQEFANAEEALKFLEQVAGVPPLVSIDPARLTPEVLAAFDTNRNVIQQAKQDAPAKRPRKPRADAGKKREPYGPRVKEAAAPETAGASQQDSPRGTDKACPAPAAPAPITGPEIPTQDVTPAAALTLDDVKAAMRKLADVEGKGTPACIAMLRSYGVLQASLLKPEQYEKFIADVLAQVSAK